MGGAALHNDLVNYSDVYAHDTNQQLLNNLARAACSDQPYFVQLGQITAQHTFMGSAGAALDPSLHDHYGATAGLSGTEQPSFQFVPVTGTNFMAAVSTPISSKIFLTFYDQGKPADILARVMLDAVTIATPTGKKDKAGNPVRIFHLLKNDPLDPSYPNFLLFCIQLRDKQLNDFDFIAKTSSGKPIPFTEVKVGEIASATWSGMSVGVYTNSSSTNPVANAVTLSKASDLGLSEKFDTEHKNYRSEGIYYWSKDKTNLAGWMTFGEDSKNSQADMDELNSGAQNTNFDVVSPSGNTNSWLVWMKTRTFMSVLNATAKETSKFAEAQGIPSLPHDVFKSDSDGLGTLTFTATNYTSATKGSKTLKICYVVQPILRLSPDVADRLRTQVSKAATCNLTTQPNDQGDATYQPVASVDYAGTTYVLGDLMDKNGLPMENDLRDIYSNGDERQLANLLSSNKEVFDLISDLYMDIAIDPKNLPVQQLIQVQ